MKIDCNKTVNFIPEKERMCGSFDDCLDCPLNSTNNSVGAGCEIMVTSHTDKAVEIVQKWSDEHQQKTYAEDFFEKFPNAAKEIGGTPKSCWRNVYGSGNDCPVIDHDCAKCWNQTMEESK